MSDWIYKKADRDKFPRAGTRYKVPRPQTTLHSPGSKFWAIDEKGFNDRIINNGPDKCWGWQGAWHRQGYGMYHITTDEGRKMTTNIRIAGALKLGRPLAKGEFAISTCRDFGCSNPNHILVSSTVNRGRFKRSKGMDRLTDEFKQENVAFILEGAPADVRERFGWTPNKLGNTRQRLKKEIRDGRIIYHGLIK